MIYTVRPCLIHTCPSMPMLRSDHAVLLKATAQHVRRACGLPARVRLLPATTRSSTKVVIRRVPVSDAGGQCETKHRLSWTRKRVVAAHYKKDDLLHCWTSSSDNSSYHADFHEGHGTIGARHYMWINARHGRGMACYVWIGLKKYLGLQLESDTRKSNVRHEAVKWIKLPETIKARQSYEKMPLKARTKAVYEIRECVLQNLDGPCTGRGFPKSPATLADSDWKSACRSRLQSRHNELCVELFRLPWLRISVIFLSCTSNARVNTLQVEKPSAHTTEPPWGQTLDTQTIKELLPWKGYFSAKVLCKPTSRPSVKTENSLT